MNQAERREYLIKELIKENSGYTKMYAGYGGVDKKTLLRSLMNVRMAAPISPEFERIQDEYLKEVNQERGIVTFDDIKQVQPNMYIWQGDITRLACDAIVNAANSGMTGCYQPCHNCIDNATPY